MIDSLYLLLETELLLLGSASAFKYYKIYNMNYATVSFLQGVVEAGL